MYHFKQKDMNEAIVKMMHRYFLNKDKIKRIKRWRMEYMSSLVADEKEICEFSCMVAGNYSATCSQCKRRNAYYNDIKKLGHINSGLLRSIKSKVYKSNILTNDKLPF